MAHTRDDVTAAPPDSAGHLGSFTRPEDEMQVVDREDGRKYPESDQDPADPGGRGSAASVWTWAIAFLIVVMFFFYALGGGC